MIRLKQGLAALNLKMPLAEQERLLGFLAFLKKWNKAYNLTAISDISEMITLHVLDSLAIAPHLTFAERVIDVGTGAGFPGIPLAFYFPEKQFVLLDSNGKKTRFLMQAKAELAIENIEIVQSRAEEYQTISCFDAIIFRAVKSIQVMLEKTRHLCCKNGQFLAMKATCSDEEIAAILQPTTVHTLSVPNLNAERHLVIIKN